ncbi:MAG TPA: hypothetical protein VIM62_06465, partial [Acidobacteriaceae bacterium]
MAHAAHAKVLPADLSAPAFVKGWQARALMVAVLFAVVAAALAFFDGSAQHIYRAWIVGTVLTFGFAVGGLAVLMLQYVTGGKWGLLLRRPLEAMSRTLPLVVVYWIVLSLFVTKLYTWANPQLANDDLAKGLISQAELGRIMHAIEWKHAMLNVSAWWGVGIVCFAIWGFYMWKLS